MRKSNVFVYALDNKVVFPYTEFQTSILFEDFISKRYDDLIGFITETRCNNLSSQHSRNQSIYGTLMRINNSFCSLINETTESNNYILEGLMFARFKVISLKPHETGYLADIEILDDFVNSKGQDTVRSSENFQNLINKILQYQSELYLPEIEINDYIENIKKEKKINKLVFNIAAKLDLKIQDSLQLLEAKNPVQRVDLLGEFIDYKINKLRLNRFANKTCHPKL